MQLNHEKTAKNSIFQILIVTIVFVAPELRLKQKKGLVSMLNPLKLDTLKLN
jgi:hypothetical protein